jgi:hypothetical protein
VSARWRLHFPKITFDLGVAALIALSAQAAAIAAPLGDDDSPRRVLFVFSYLLLLAFCLANLNHFGIAIIFVGLAMNAAAILANGGLMPITPETVERTGELPADARIGEWLPGSKDVLLERKDVRLYPLSDRLVLHEISGVIRAFSPGDVVIAAGLLVTVIHLLLPSIERVRGGSRTGARSGDEQKWPVS